MVEFADFIGSLIAWSIDGNEQGTYGVARCFRSSVPDDATEAILEPRTEPGKYLASTQINSDGRLFNVRRVGQSLHSLILEICCQISFLLFPLYVLFNPKLVDTGDRIFFQMTNTAVCLVQNDYLLTTVGSKEKFRIRLAV